MGGSTSGVVVWIVQLAAGVAEVGKVPKTSLPEMQ
jgi:hypothetical protein